MLERYNLDCLFLLKARTKSFLLSRLNNFMTCCGRFNIQSEGSISLL